MRGPRSGSSFFDRYVSKRCWAEQPAERRRPGFALRQLVRPFGQALAELGQAPGRQLAASATAETTSNSSPLRGRRTKAKPGLPVEAMRLQQRAILRRAGFRPALEARLVDEVDRMGLLAAVGDEQGREVGHRRRLSVMLDGVKCPVRERWAAAGVNHFLAMSRHTVGMSLRAQLDIEPEKGERRSSQRRKLRLEAEGLSASTAETQVVIHDLSEDGLLVESPVPLSQGETSRSSFPRPAPSRRSRVEQRPLLRLQVREPNLHRRGQRGAVAQPGVRTRPAERRSRGKALIELELCPSRSSA